MDYDLTGLGWRHFEHMVSALFEHTLGVKVGQFGDGPDGGREATFRGLTKKLGPDESPWNGYTLLQAKFRTRPLGTQADQDWLISEVDKELREWESATSARAKATDRPDYIIIATNVHLTPASGGGIDRLERVIAARKDLRLKGHLVWHAHKISRMLDDAADIRRAYAALITPGDVLAKLHDLLEGEGASIGNDLRAFATQSLVQQRHVRLTEAGGTGNLTLEQVAVDLPSSSLAGTERTSLLQALLDLGDRDLGPSASDDLDPTYLVLGGPGQGKSTMSNILTQLYRIALLKDDPHRNKQCAQILDESLEWIERENLRLPVKRRWPIRLELGELPMGEPLLKSITANVTKILGQQVPATAIFSFMKQWPWVLVLDGLDEVASAEAREAIQSSVTAFLARAASENCDLMTIITTRPQGYDHEFDVPGVAKVELLPLKPVDAIAYASRFAQVHFGDDSEQRERVLSSLRDSASDDNVARLLQSPLQATIMTLLLADHGHAPRDRHLLFDAYYETIYKREAAKKQAISKDLNEFRAEVHSLHAQVGLRLQQLSERSGNFEAVLAEDDLRHLVERQLLDAGHEPEDAKALAERLVRVAAHRLVLLVPRGDRGIGFEVRSLQEYMAARALTSGPENELLNRLGVLAPSAHWRNAWLLAIGRMMRDHPHLERQILDMVRTPNGDPLARRLGVGVELAAALVLDGIGVTRPIVRNELLNIVMEAFDMPPLPFDVGNALELLAGERAVLKSVVLNHLGRLDATSPPDVAITARHILQPLAGADGALGLASRHVLKRIKVDGLHQEALGNFKGSAVSALDGVNQVDLATLIPDIRELVEEEGMQEASALVAELARAKVLVKGQPAVVLSGAANRRIHLRYPEGPDVRLALATALEGAPRESWCAVALMTEALWKTLRRAPVGDRV